MNIRKLSALFLVLLAGSALAQEKLDTAVISSTRLQTSYKETGKTVEIITAKEIAAMPVNSVEDVLQNVAGVNLNARAGFGIQTDIGLRGSTFSQVVILIDNQRLNDGLTGHFNNNIPVSLAEIAQIEVIKGPSSTSYGADAVGGVIHIKTKTYVAEPKLKLNFTGKVSKGQYGLDNHDLGLYLNTKKWAVSGGMKRLNADGQEFVNPNFAQGNGDSLYKSHFDQRNYTLSGVYFKDNWKFYARGAIDVRDFGAKYFYTASSFDESEEMVRAQWVQAAVINQGKRQHTELNVGYKHNRDTFVFNPTFPSTNGHTTTRLNATVTQNVKIKKVKLAYGLQYDGTTIESTDRGDHSNYSVAAFAQTRFNLIDNLLVLVGARAENNDKYGFQFVPQVTGTYILPKLVIRSSIGQAIRNPDYTERFVSFNIPSLSPNRNVGNPDVEPEVSSSYDLNFDWTVSDKFRWSHSVFYRNSSNLIDYILTNSNQINNLGNLAADTTYFYTQNINQSQTMGYEMSGSYQFFKTDSTALQVQANYTFLETSNNGDEVSKYIANHPIHNVGFEVMGRYKRFRASLNGNYITRNAEEIPSIDGIIYGDYLLLNARISFKPPVLPARIFVEGRNLLDTDYQEILGARMPGRWIYAGFIWQWGQKLFN